MDRERARHRFWVTYAVGLGLTGLSHLTDLPRALVLPVAVVYCPLLGWFGLGWLRAAIRDDSLRRAIPDYALAFLSLVLIALACGWVTLVVLVALGADFTVTDVSTGAFFGTFAVLGAWWLLRGRHVT